MNFHSDNFGLLHYFFILMHLNFCDPFKLKPNDFLFFESDHFK